MRDSHSVCQFLFADAEILLLICCSLGFRATKATKSETNAAMTQPKEPIRLRQRKTPSGKISLYLDIYISGKRSYEYLNLYLMPERTREDKERNKQTLSLAEAIRSKRVVELRNHRFGFDSNFSPQTNLFDYIDMLMERRKAKSGGGNWANWRGYVVQMSRFAPATTTLGDIDASFAQRWKVFLRDEAYNSHYKRSKPVHLSQSAQCNYWRKFACTINTAVQEGIISKNPLRGIEGVKDGSPERVYLTLDELKRMIATPCRNKELRRAFLFSCLTGLRVSDIKKMTWKEVGQCGKFTRITFAQQKTKEQEYLDISKDAASLLGERGNPSDLVFGDLRIDHYSRNELRAWALDAGISKHIVFHTGRHTFAVVMLELGTDIYTLQKLLGHRELRTTQRYAEVLDKKKQEAIARIPSLLNEDSEKE